MTFMAGTVVEDKKILSCKKISVKNQNSEGPKYNNPVTQTRGREEYWTDPGNAPAPRLDKVATVGGDEESR